jgi:pimeloyl-ACP methyl ester carboxylesterase
MMGALAVSSKPEEHMPTLKVNGTEIYFERHGDAGDPIVFVHGYTGSVEDWTDQVAAFAPTHRVLMIDHRGHGRSHAPVEESAYAVGLMADDVEAIADEAGFLRYHLVGHSMGGAVSQEIALRSPHRLLSLTLEDTGPSFDFGRNEIVTKVFAERLRVAREEGMAAVAALPGLPDPPHMPPGRRAFEHQRLSAMSPHGFLGAWGAMNAWEGTRERAHRIATPSMVIYGELDRMVIRGMEFLAEAIPGASSEMIAEAAHCPQFERPELFNAALRRHLERNAAAPAK